MMTSRTGWTSPAARLAASNALPRATSAPAVTRPVSPGDTKACSRGLEPMSACARGNLF